MVSATGRRVLTAPDRSQAELVTENALWGLQLSPVRRLAPDRSELVTEKALWGL